MTEDEAPRVGIAPRWFHLAFVLLGGAGLAVFALTVLGRVAFPWPLEWMEGVILQNALRLVAFESLYPAPSAEHVPLLYPPLGYLPFAVAVALFGPSLEAARWVSLACNVVTLACTGRAAYRLSSSAAVGVAAAGLFAAGYGYAGAFLDLVRVDAVLLALLAAALDALTAGRLRLGLVLLVCSVFVKQHALLAFGACVIGLVLERPAERRLAIASVVCWLAVAGLLELATGGGFGRYVLWLPSRHGIEPVLLASFFLVDLCVYLPVLVLASLAGARTGSSLVRYAIEPQRVPAATLLAVLFALLLMGALGRAHPGGHDNVRLPALLALCVLAAPIAGRAMAVATTRFRLLVLGLFAAQLGVLYQPPSYHAPTEESARAFAALRSALERCALQLESREAHANLGAVALDYALLTGKPYAHTMAISDLRLGGESSELTQSVEALRTELASRHGPRALAVGTVMPELREALARSYEECTRVPAPRPATGYVPGLDSATGPHVERVQRVLVRKPL